MQNTIRAIVLMLPLAIVPTAWADGETPAPVATSSATQAGGACQIPEPKPCGTDPVCSLQQLNQQLEAHNKCMEKLARDAVSPVPLPAQ